MGQADGFEQDNIGKRLEYGGLQSIGRYQDDTSARKAFVRADVFENLRAGQAGQVHIQDDERGNAASKLRRRLAAIMNLNQVKIGLQGQSKQVIELLVIFDDKSKGFVSHKIMS